MKLKWNICGEEDRLFNRLYACHVENCSAAECKKHKGRVLKACPDCGYYFCSAHINNHKCDVEEYEEYEDDREEIEDGNEENNDVTNETLEIKTTIDKSLHLIEGDYKDVINSIEEIIQNISRDNKITNIVPIIHSYYRDCAVIIFSEPREKLQNKV